MGWFAEHADLVLVLFDPNKWLSSRGQIDASTVSFLIDQQFSPGSNQQQDTCTCNDQQLDLHDQSAVLLLWFWDFHGFSNFVIRNNSDYSNCNLPETIGNDKNDLSSWWISWNHGSTLCFRVIEARHQRWIPALFGSPRPGPHMRL